MNNTTTKSMQNFTFIKARGKRLLLILFFALTSLNIFAEGTHKVSPNAINISALLSAPDLLSGPYFNMPEDNLIQFSITNSATQNLYFGVDRSACAAGNPARLTGVYWRIKRSSDLVVVGSTLRNSNIAKPSSIDKNAQALAVSNVNGATAYFTLLFFIQMSMIKIPSPLIVVVLIIGI